jgi:hypothetical protein
MVSEGLAEGLCFKPSHFMREEDQDIVRIVSEIDTDNYELSQNWLNKYKIDTNTELDKLKNAVLHGIYVFKSDKLQQRIDEIRIELAEVAEMDNFKKVEDLLIEQINLEKVKSAFSEQLGRIVLR